jgi:hypothetical protein
MLHSISEGLNGQFDKFAELIKIEDAASDSQYGLFFENYDGMVQQKFTGKPVHAAAYYGRIEFLQLLNDVYGSACFNDTKSEFWEQVKFEKNPVIVTDATPMMWACASGNKKTFDFLRKLGASEVGCDTCQMSQLHYAKMK